MDMNFGRIHSKYIVQERRAAVFVADGNIVNWQFKVKSIFVRAATSNKRLNKRTKEKDNEHMIFVNVVKRSTFATIEKL